MIEYEIKKARICDTNDIGALITSCWQESYKKIIDADYLKSLSSSERADFVMNALLSGSFLAYCAWHNDQLVGVCLFRTSSVPGIAGYGELSCLYVKQEFTNRGIGGKLLNTSIDYMRSVGLTYVILNVLQENTSGVRFYEKRGFEKINENQLKLGGREYPFYLMRKKI